MTPKRRPGPLSQTPSGATNRYTKPTVDAPETLSLCRRYRDTFPSRRTHDWLYCPRCGGTSKKHGMRYIRTDQVKPRRRRSGTKATGNGEGAPPPLPGDYVTADRLSVDKMIRKSYTRARGTGGRVMTRKALRRLVVPAGVYVVLWICVQAGEQSVFPKRVTELLSHFVTILSWVVAAAAISLILDEVIADTILPTFEKGFEKLANVVGAAITAIKLVIGERFGEIASVAAGKIITQEAPRVTDSEIAALITSGNLPGAIAKLKDEVHRDSSNLQKKRTLVTTLLLSHERREWDEAWSLMRTEVDMVREHLTMALRYWGVGRIDTAIEVCKSGLERAEADSSLEGRDIWISKLKNSLAYYYAETGRAEYEDAARRYVEEAIRIRPEEMACLDTKAYVKIVYGKDRGEVLEGVTLAEDARRKGLEDEFYFKHIEKARQRLASL